MEVEIAYGSNIEKTHLRCKVMIEKLYRKLHRTEYSKVRFNIDVDIQT